VKLRCGSDLAVPACLVGWSEPGNQATDGDICERPEDPPAREIAIPPGSGSVRPHLYLLAQARRPLSVHPADLRLALPGLPHPRPAVLQPR
jgi:hypothetical protein